MSTSHYKVFLPAPTYAEIRSESNNSDNSRSSERKWKIHELSSAKPNSLSRRDTEIVEAQTATEDFVHSRGWILPPGTLEAAGSRISELYKNVIFGDDDVEDDDKYTSRRFEDFTTSAFGGTTVLKFLLLLTLEPTSKQKHKPKAVCFHGLQPIPNRDRPNLAS